MGEECGDAGANRRGEDKGEVGERAGVTEKKDDVQGREKARGGDRDGREK